MAIFGFANMSEGLSLTNRLVLVIYSFVCDLNLRYQPATVVSFFGEPYRQRWRMVVQLEFDWD